MAAGTVAVVGAGLAGVAAADQLRRAGVRVELFERSRLLGGRATSFELDGREIDNGQHVFLACCTEFIDFAAKAGMADALYLQERFDALVLARGGRAGRLRAGTLPAPLHLLASLARYAHLSASAKLRLGRGLTAMVLQSRRPQPEGSFAQWLAQLGQGDAQLRAFWEPFFVPALNAPFDCVSREDGAFVFANAFLHDAGAARFGWSTVPLARIAETVAARLDRVHRSTPVTAIRGEADGRIAIRVKDAWLHFDGAVLAVTPPQLARLLGEPESFGVRHLDEYAPYPIVDVHLWHDRASVGFEFAALIESPVQWIFEKAPGYLCCSLSAPGELARLTTAELTQRCWLDVRATVTALRGASLARSAVTRNPDATFVCRPGVKRTGVSTRLPNLTIAGSWTDTGWPDTMESAVRSGRTAAKTLALAQTLCYVN